MSKRWNFKKKPELLSISVNGSLGALSRSERCLTGCRTRTVNREFILGLAPFLHSPIGAFCFLLLSAVEGRNALILPSDNRAANNMHFNRKFICYRRHGNKMGAMRSAFDDKCINSSPNSIIQKDWWKVPKDDLYNGVWTQRFRERFLERQAIEQSFQQLLALRSTLYVCFVRKEMFGNQ